MELITKEVFLEKAYALVNKTKSDFFELSKVSDSELDDLFNIESAVYTGQAFLMNYRVYQFGMRAREEDHRFYLTDEGTPAFTTNAEFMRMGFADEETPAWPVPDSEGERIYG